MPENNNDEKTKKDLIRKYMLGIRLGDIPPSEYIPHQIDAPHCIRVVKFPKDHKNIKYIQVNYNLFNGGRDHYLYQIKNQRRIEPVKDKNTKVQYPVIINHYDRLQIQLVSMSDQSPQSILTTSKDIYIRYYNVKTVRTINFAVAVPMDNEKYFDWDIALQEKYFKELRADVAYHDGKKVYVCESNRVYEVRIFAFGTSHNTTQIASVSMQGILINYWRYNKQALQKIWSSP